MVKTSWICEGQPGFPLKLPIVNLTLGDICTVSPALTILLLEKSPCKATADSASHICNTENIKLRGFNNGQKSTKCKSF